MTVVVLVQARTGSTRLPNKVFEDIEGVPMLGRVLERAASARRVDRVAVATTSLERDDAIERFAEQLGHRVHRGSEHDVLDRYVRAAKAEHADVVVRITSDCPLLDPALVDDTLAALEEGYDFAANTLEPRTFPRGLDVETMTIDALLRAGAEDDDPASREHVTPYIYRHPELFRLTRIANDEDLSAHRWTVDTPADLALVREIYRHVSADAGFREVLEATRAHPEWSAINAGVEQKSLPAG